MLTSTRPLFTGMEEVLENNCRSTFVRDPGELICISAS